MRHDINWYKETWKDFKFFLFRHRWFKIAKVSFNASDYHEMKDDDETTAYYKDWSDRIMSSPNHLKAVTWYCGYKYEHINQRLRGLYKADGVYEEILDELTKDLKSAIDTAPVTRENYIVWRAVCREFIEQLSKDSLAGRPSVEEGFMSTCISQKDLNKVDTVPPVHILKIYVPKGTKGSYIEGIKGNGMGRGEKEIILNHRGNLCLINRPYYAWNKKYIIYELLLMR